MELIIAEKPSVAQSIAKVLKINERKDGYMQGNGYMISWCIGHLIELAPTEAYDETYEKWRYSDLPIIPQKWKYAVSKDKQKQFKTVSDLMKNKEVESVICATDAGREGELIFRLVYDYCGCRKPIRRLWISSLEESAIADGFRNLKDGKEYEKLYKAALCRQQADWIVGINSTRLFSVLYKDTLNVGRVMTPTLALITEREKEIAVFVKEPFYVPEIECQDFTASGEKTKDIQTAERIRAECDGGTANVISVRKTEKPVLPPKLYDLTTLQREANRMFGFTSQQTLDCVQSLYEKKLTTYPRTDSRYLTDDMAVELPSLIGAVAGVIPFAKGAKPYIDIKRVIDNSKVTDHHAIIPTRTMTETDLSSLPSAEKDILHMIAVRLICAAGETHICNETEIILECRSHEFKAKGKSIAKNGWKTIDRAFKNTLKNNFDDDAEDEKTLPEPAEGQQYVNVRAGIREGFTTPPKHYTEDTLLSAMECAGDFSDIPDAERKGLGTPATRAGIIEKLVKGKFIERHEAKKVKNLLPTEKGANLISVLPDVVKSPELTAEWESKLKKVEQGILPETVFMNGIAEMTNGLVRTHTAAKPEYVSLFAPKAQQGDAIGMCPRCGGSVRESVKGFFCENSQSCGFALWKDNKFFTSKKKDLNKKAAIALLKEGRVFMSGLYSEKTGKTYDAVIILDITSGKYVNFQMEFKNNK